MTSGARAKIAAACAIAAVLAAAQFGTAQDVYDPNAPEPADSRPEQCPDPWQQSVTAAFIAQNDGKPVAFTEDWWNLASERVLGEGIYQPTLNPPVSWSGGMRYEWRDAYVSGRCRVWSIGPIAYHRVTMGETKWGYAWNTSGGTGPLTADDTSSDSNTGGGYSSGGGGGGTGGSGATTVSGGSKTCLFLLTYDIATGEVVSSILLGCA